MNPIVKKQLTKVLDIMSNLGLNVRKIISYRYLFRFIRERNRFIRLGGKGTSLYPILDNYYESAGSCKGHYFHQDLLVATFINKDNPDKHIDVGSRIDGFVAHVASFREIEIIDVRNLTDIPEHNIKFKQADLIDLDKKFFNLSDSLSCLHAIEHFGLGRYNDKLDPDGHIKGFVNLCKMLKPNGLLYISFPIGQPRVYFNAHRVFSPQEILFWIEENDLDISLIRYDFVDDNGDLNLNLDIKDTPELEFGCGIYTLRKKGGQN